MNEYLTTGLKSVGSFLQTRTGFLGLGPSYGEIIMTTLIAYAVRRSSERSIVREAENILAEIEIRNQRL